MIKNLKCACVCMKIAFILLFVGGLNWGLVGIGGLFGFNLNLVNLLLGGLPVIESIVYILVGVSAFVTLFGCSCCKKCEDGTCCMDGKCDPEIKTEEKTAENM